MRLLLTLVRWGQVRFWGEGFARSARPAGSPAPAVRAAPLLVVQACAEAGLDAALAAGGTNTFSCASATTMTNNAISDNAGGILTVNSSTTTLYNTIIANNAGASCLYDLGSTTTADTSNLADDNTCGGATVKTAAQINLLALANNTGPTQTMALGAGSAAVNAANTATSPASDQRGLARRLAGNPQFCDVGAFQAQPAANTITGGATQSTFVNTAFVNTLQVTVTDASANTLGRAVVTFTVPTSGASAILSSSTTTNVSMALQSTSLTCIIGTAWAAHPTAIASHAPAASRRCPPLEYNIRRLLVYFHQAIYARRYALATMPTFLECALDGLDLTA